MNKKNVFIVVVQKHTEVHFWVLIIMATLFTTGILMYMWEFLKHGKPSDEALEAID